MESGYLSLTGKYNGQNLELLTSLQPEQWWNENPIILSPEEQKAVDLAHICEILIKKNLSPLVIASFSSQQMQDPVINKIETVYQQAISNYKKIIKNAVKSDVSQALQMNEEFLQKINQQPNHKTKSALLGSTFFLIGAIPGYFVGVSQDKKQRAQNLQEKWNIQRICSSERRSALSKIHELEVTRYQQIKTTLREAGSRVQQLFHSRMESEIYDESLLEKFRLYEKMYRTFFPEDQFIISDFSEEVKIAKKEGLSLLPQEVQKWIKIKCLVSNDSEGEECGQLIPQIAMLCKDIEERSKNLVFAEILKFDRYSHLKKYLVKLECLCKLGWAEPFFQCAVSKRVDYYPAFILFDMIDAFESIAASHSLSNMPHPFPPYDAGGKEILVLLKNPSNLNLSFPTEMLMSQNFNNIKALGNKSTALNAEEDISQMVSQVIEKFAGKDRTVNVPLSQKNVEIIKSQYLRVIQLCQKWMELPIDRLVEMAESISKKFLSFEEKNIQLVALGCMAIFKEFNKYLYAEQVLTVLGLLCFPKGCIAQVKTGEGKTLIDMLLAFVLAMQGKTVHLISSSSNLVQRDQQASYQLFKTFGIHTSSICELGPKAEKFQSQIIYGTVHDFEFAIMREMLDNEILFPQKNHFNLKKRFESVIIDEVDNLILDRLFNHARASYPAEATCEWVYLPIFTFVKSYIRKSEKEKLDASSTLAELKDFLNKYLKENFLKKEINFSDEKLQAWLHSAYAALYIQKENDDYFVQLLSEADKERGILIVDAKNTGETLPGSRWGNGMHEFLEVKHELSPKKESLTPLSMSHAVFYHFYETVYGLTGTLGSQYERDEIKEIYGMDSFDVPTHFPCIRVDMPLLVVDTMEIYWKTIVQRVVSYRDKQRPILVLCESIKVTNELSALLKENKLDFDVFNGIQKDSVENILKRASRPGAATIATNTGGRGVDIILQLISLISGGLHVLFIFYPDSLRTEDQGRGRAGRQGQDGSSEIIISRDHLKNKEELKDFSSSEIELYLNKTREIVTLQRKEHHKTQACFDHYRFNCALDFFASLHQFRSFLQDSASLNRLAVNLSKLKILQLRTQQEVSDPIDVQLRDLLYKFMTNGSQQMSYVLLLKKVGDKIIDRCLKRWAIEFYQKTDDLLIKGGTISNSQEWIRQIDELFLDLADERFSEEKASILIRDLERAFKEQQLLSMKQKIADLFQQSKSYWEMYLDPSGKGLILYLQDISGLDLKPDLPPTSRLNRPALAN